MARTERRLSAILHADLAGFVRLVENQEELTFEHLRSARDKIWQPAIEDSGGSLVHSAGDAMPAIKINPILTRVAFPVFAKVQLDNERLKRGYLTLVWLLATTNGPILVGGAAVAGSLIPLVFGEQWAPMMITPQTRPR